jgi:predicted RNA-binding Zn-ribbon protein involved in translation (DUF1610 family)
MITCPNCKKSFTPPAGATVATCPNCGAQVSLTGAAGDAGQPY